MGVEKEKVRVLVVDDSAVMRRLVSNLLDRDAEIEVVGTAIDGDFALSRIEHLRPDVITLDVDMPRMDGLSTLRQIVSRYSIPVVMLSSLTTNGASLTMQALEIGASDFVCKPKNAAQLSEMGEELVSKIKGAARCGLIRGIEPVTKPSYGRPSSSASDNRAEHIIAIGASSGGPHALRYLLPRLPCDLGAAVVIVQHMPESFTAMLAYWLNEICSLEVSEAKSGDLIVTGKVLIAPGNTHMRIKRRPIGGEIVLESGPLVSGHMPSVDVLFRSIAQEYGVDSTGVIMTGMGSDGASGIGEIKNAGGHTIAQDEDSCVIFGMPRVAIEKGHINKVVSLTDLASYLVSTVGQKRASLGDRQDLRGSKAIV